MGLRVERVPTLSDNYTYVIACEDTGEAAIVDAPEAPPVVKRVDELGVKVVKVLSTHLTNSLPRLSLGPPPHTIGP